ncbi:MAG: sigma-54 dependent transcriptional regulator [Deltaproteobacteria bacterium]|jgi:DNA-binding NtrC family response regulator
MRQAVLIVDDMVDMQKFLSRLIGRSLAVDLYTASDGERALEIMAEKEISVVLADIRMPKMDGLTLLGKIKQHMPSTIVIMMTAFGSIENAVTSLKQGAYDYVAKPFDEERLLHIVSKALEHHALAKRSSDLEKKIREKETLQAFIGNSQPLRAAVGTLRRAAAAEATILITGETGTGKDLAARMIHELSPRSGKPFVAVNCPAIPENILESELFGYRKGAFTGADHDKEGLFEAAEGGTIVLDEIGDITPTLQAKLLRVLQDKEIRPLGDNRSHRVNVRIIAATNRDLLRKMAEGAFRDDLYYRLNVISIRMPSLRDIPEDIPLIANHFLGLYCAAACLTPKRFSEDALRLLMSRTWSGNVRQLQNAIQRAVIFSRGALIEDEDFDFQTNKADCLDCIESEHATFREAQFKEAKNRILKNFEIQYISHLLEELGGNVSLAARTAGLERQSLQYLMRKHNISAEQFRNPAK